MSDFPEPYKHIEEDTTVVLDRKKEKLMAPPNYAVLLHNDDYTPMKFVVHILQHFFQHNSETATMIMLEVHNLGKGLAGVYTKDIAETKAAIAKQEAVKNEHALLITVEEMPSG